VKLIECLEDLQTWDDYKEFLKIQLKQLEGSGEPFFVSKEKISFDCEGKSWNGFAFLTGPKATPCVRKLQKEGVIFREGTCTRQGKELAVEGLDRKLVKEAAKTLKKLVLGFKIAGAEEEEEGGASSPDAGGAAASEGRGKKVDELKKLRSDLDRLLAVLNR
jgi:hypothetical protein